MIRPCQLEVIQPSQQRSSFSGVWPGGPGRLPTRGSHRPVRAFLMHTVPQIMGLLRDGVPSGPPAPAEADNAPVAG
jgi:hypothetical protein